MPVIIGLFLIAACFTAYNLMAEQRDPKGLPPEIQACENLNSGDKCSFVSRDGNLKTEVCKNITTPMGKELSCGDMSKPPGEGGKR